MADSILKLAPGPQVAGGVESARLQKRTTTWPRIPAAIGLIAANAASDRVVVALILKDTLCVAAWRSTVAGIIRAPDAADVWNEYVRNEGGVEVDDEDAALDLAVLFVTFSTGRFLQIVADTPGSTPLIGSTSFTVKSIQRRKTGWFVEGVLGSWYRVKLRIEPDGAIQAFELE